MNITLEKINKSFAWDLKWDAGLAWSEMISSEIIKDEIHFDDFIDLREPEYRKNYSPWNYTDDRADTKAVIKLLSSNDPFDKEFLLKYMLQEIHDDVARTWDLRQWYGIIKDMFEVKKWQTLKTIEEIRNIQGSRDDPGNAPLMRCLPLAFIQDEKLRNKYCDVVADVTHPHLLSRECTKLTVQAIRHILIEDVIQWQLIDTLLESYSWVLTDDLSKINKLPHPDILKNEHIALIAWPQPNPYMKLKWKEVYGLNGTCTSTAKSVIYLLKHCTTPFEGYKQSLLMWWDVDSLGALVLWTLWWRYGHEWLPSYLERSEWLDEIPALAENFLEALPRHE